jgi:hypothetical protein
MILGKDDPTRMKGNAVLISWLYNIVSLCILFMSISLCSSFTECIAAIRDKTGKFSEDDRLAAFDELEMIVEGIDNASNMQRMNLWPDIFACISPCESVQVVRFALWIIGTCAQNNPETQKDLLEKHSIFSMLLTLWQDETHPSCQIQPKIMYCLSALLSNNPAGLSDFVTRDGFKIIDKFVDGGEVEGKLRFLLCRVLAKEIGPDALRCLIEKCSNLLNIFENGDDEDI